MTSPRCGVGAQCLLLLLGEFGGNANLHPDYEVATATASETRRPLAPDAERGTGLGSPGNREKLLPTVDEGHFHLRAKGGLHHVERKGVKQVVTIADEVGMGAHHDLDI